jgi:chemotaxis response regulator CheB
VAARPRRSGKSLKKGPGTGAKAAATPDRAHLIVGGASAGGIDAFKAFFTRMPVESGMSFILVQHLDPTYESSLASIVAGYTKMPVHLAEDGAAIKRTRSTSCAWDRRRQPAPRAKLRALQGGRVRRL